MIYGLNYYDHKKRKVRCNSFALFFFCNSLKSTTLDNTSTGLSLTIYDHA